MSTTQVRMIGAALFFLLIFLFGFWLSRNGKPYNGILFNLHKLIALGVVVFLAIAVVRVHQAASLGPAQVVIVAITAVCFLAAIVTGGLISALKDVPAFVRLLHHVTPYLVLLSTALMLYALLVKNSQVIATSL